MKINFKKGAIGIGALLSSTLLLTQPNNNEVKEERNFAEEHKIKEERRIKEATIKNKESQQISIENKKNEEEQKRIEEENRKKQEEQKRIEEENRKKQEEQKRIEEENRKKQEEQRLAEELNTKKRECEEQWGKWINNSCTWETQEENQYNQAEAQQQYQPQAKAYYKNCAEARAAGVTPLYKGDPGYRPQLDRDKDGVACE